MLYNSLLSWAFHFLLHIWNFQSDKIIYFYKSCVCCSYLRPKDCKIKQKLSWLCWYTNADSGQSLLALGSLKLNLSLDSLRVNNHYWPRPGGPLWAPQYFPAEAVSGTSIYPSATPLRRLLPWHVMTSQKFLLRKWKRDQIQTNDLNERKHSAFSMKGNVP